MKKNRNQLIQAAGRKINRFAIFTSRERNLQVTYKDNTFTNSLISNETSINNTEHPKNSSNTKYSEYPKITLTPTLLEDMEDMEGSGTDVTFPLEDQSEFTLTHSLNSNVITQILLHSAFPGSEVSITDQDVVPLIFAFSPTSSTYGEISQPKKCKSRIQKLIRKEGSSSCDTWTNKKKKKQHKFGYRQILTIQSNLENLNDYSTQEQYNKQQQLNRFIEETENVENNYEIEETNVNMLLINLEELENKENHEELYRYKKEKLQTKLHIFVLMIVIEDRIKVKDKHIDSPYYFNKVEKYDEKETKYTQEVNNDMTIIYMDDNHVKTDHLY
ncbi:hypothetical protein PMALA_071330 [Plasmodium malariae]|uniref:Uncharacterized protein n=1 Tax=Plasmodium malariae TaxID=5858 RepID=A0A1A8X721_PLAMA|nr:hypothetical protein PMALA_071330 [Plasmodium malariae]